MGFAIHTKVRLVPGDNTFTLLLDAQDRLRDYGWTDVSMNSGPAGKITTVEDREIIFYLNGRAGATDGTASSDVEAALKNTGAWKHTIANVSANVQQAINDETNAAAASAENAALAPAKAAAKGAIIMGCIAIAAIGLTVYLVARAQKG